MDEHSQADHISLRVLTSRTVTRQIREGHLVDSVIVTGEVLTPPQTAGERISLLILWPEDLDSQDYAMLDDEKFKDSLLLCTNCLPQYGALSHETGKAAVALTEEGLPRWMANRAFWCGTDSSRRMLYGMTRVTVLKAQNSGQRSRAHIDILQTHLVTQLHTLGDMREFFTVYMSGQHKGAEQNANCLIRLVSTKTGKSLMLWLYSARLEIKLPDVPGRQSKSFNVPGDAQMAWNEAVTLGSQAKGLAKMLAAVLSGDLSGVAPEHAELASELKDNIKSGEVVVEAIPGERIRIVGDSLERLIFPEQFPDSSIALNAHACEMTDPSGGKRIQGFLPMHVNVLIKPAEPDAAFPFATTVAARFYVDPGRKPLTAQQLQTANMAAFRDKRYESQ